MKALPQSERLARIAAKIAGFIERNDLLAKFYILMLCLILVLPNVWAVRTMYYVIVLPMFLIVIRKDELWSIVSSPIFIFAALYFLIFAVAAPFATQFSFRSLGEHIRTALLVVSFLGMTALLVRRNPQFPFQLFLFLAVTAAVVGLNNIWHFYGGLPPLDRVPQRFEGVRGVTMYYNANWIRSSMA